MKVIDMTFVGMDIDSITGVKNCSMCPENTEEVKTKDREIREKIKEQQAIADAYMRGETIPEIEPTNEVQAIVKEVVKPIVHNNKKKGKGRK